MFLFPPSLILATPFQASELKALIALFYEYPAHYCTEMAKKKAWSVFLPRRKEGEDPNVPRHISVSYESLEGLFHLPLKAAAREIGLCPTTFKKACRRFGLETWPFRNASSSLAGQRQAPIARRNAPTDGDDAVKVSCTSPVWHGESTSLGVPFSSIASSSSNVRASSERHRDCLNPFGAALSSAAPQGLPQGLLKQASMALDTRSYDEARHAAPAFQLKTFAPHDAPSYIDAFTRSRVVIRVPLPTPEGLPTAEACGMAQGETTPLDAGPPREKSCVEAVMEYLDLGCSISEADVASMLSNDC